MGILGFVLRLFFFFGRHGYPIVFLERRILVQTLYDHIQDKSKVLTSEKVVTVKNSPSHVTVTTSTGKSFTGDMVAGADGINSTIRQKMWEESQSIDPTWIDPSEIECMYTSNFSSIQWANPLLKPSPLHTRVCSASQIQCLALRDGP